MKGRHKEKWMTLKMQETPPTLTNECIKQLRDTVAAASPRITKTLVRPVTTYESEILKDEKY